MSGEAVTTQPRGKRAEVMAYVRDLDPSQVLGACMSDEAVLVFVPPSSHCWIMRIHFELAK